MDRQSVLQFTVRDAVIEDCDAMGRIAVAAWQFAYADFVPAEFLAARADPTARARRMRESWITDTLRLVAEDSDGRVIGFAFEERPPKLEGFDVEIGALYVDPPSSRMGVGRRLVIEMVRRFAMRGAATLAIHTLAENQIGCRFYEKLGGQAGPLTTWNEIPSKWYTWPDLTSITTTA